MRQAWLLPTLIVTAVMASPGAGSPDPWVLWTRDTKFKVRQPAWLWETGRWLVRGGPFETRDACERLMDYEIHSAANRLGPGYRVTSKVGTSLVAREVGGPGGLRRRYMCLPVSVSPPK